MSATPESLDNHLQKIAESFWTNVDSWNPPPDSLYNSFLEQTSPGCLFITIDAINTNTVSVSENLPKNSGQNPIIAIVKRGGQISTLDQICALGVPVLEDTASFEGLYSLLRFFVEPLFELSAKNVHGQNISAARQKLAELELSFVNLQHHTEITMLTLPINKIIQLEKENYSVEELNSLHETVNTWKRSIQMVMEITRDPTSGTASEEVLFWQTMETALKHIQTQIDSPAVQKTLDILVKGKRFHATAGFADSGLKETLERVAKYNHLLLDLPISDILTANTLQGLQKAVERVFTHIIKRLRPSEYPISRCLALVEAISQDFATSLKGLVSQQNLLILPEKEFKSTIKGLESLFLFWDDCVREFSSVAREVIRKRGEKFIPIRLKPRHEALQDRISFVATFRKSNSDLLHALNQVLANDPELNKLSLELGVEQAYDHLSQIDVLDTSSNGIIEWRTREQAYQKATANAERDIARILRSRLSSATSAQKMLRVFASFNLLFSRPAIRGAIQDYQSRLLQQVKSELADLRTRVGQQYTNSPSFLCATSHEIFNISGFVIFLNQVTTRLDGLLERVSAVLGPNWRFYADGEKLFSEAESFKTQIDSKNLVTNWLREMSKACQPLSGPVFGVIGGQLVVALDDHALGFFKELRALGSLGFHIPHILITHADETHRAYPFAMQLSESLCRFLALRSRIEASLEPLIADSYNNVCNLLDQGLQLEWSAFTGSTPPTKFVQAFYDSVVLLDSQYVQGSTVTERLENTVDELEKMEPTKENMRKVYVQFQIDLKDLATSSNFHIVKGYFDEKLSAALHKCLRSELDKWTEIISSETPKSGLHHQQHTILVRDQTIVIAPPLEATRSVWVRNVAEIIGRAPPEIDIDVASLVSGALNSVEQVLQAATAYFETWLTFQSLWDMDFEQLNASLETDLSKWLDLLNSLRKSRLQLDDRPFQTGALSISTNQVLGVINAKYDFWQGELVHQISSLTRTKASDIHRELIDLKTAMESVSFSVMDINVLLKNARTLETSQSCLGGWNESIEQVRQAQLVLTQNRSEFPADWLYGEQLSSENMHLQKLIQRREQELEHSLDTIKAFIDVAQSSLNSVLETFVREWHAEKPVSGDSTPEVAMQILQRFKSDVETHTEQQKIVEACTKVFGVDNKVKISLDEVSEEISDFTVVWSAVTSGWSDMRRLEELPWPQGFKQLRSTLNNVLGSSQEIPLRVRQYAAFVTLQKSIRERLESLTALSILAEDTLSARHWALLFDSILGTPPPIPLTVGDIWSLKPKENINVINEVVSHAAAEARLQKFLDDIEECWLSFELEFVEFRGTTRIIKNWTEVLKKLEEDLQALGAMHYSEHFSVFEHRTVDWEQKLSRLRDIFDVWVDVQRQWVYLQGVFIAPEIKVLLSSEAAKFRLISSEFLALLQLVGREALAINLLSMGNVIENLKRIRDQLQKLQKALSDYFEKQRLLFPRLYFLGDEDLLELIGNPGIPALQRHISKLFLGVSEILVQDGSASGVRSPQGEELLFVEPVPFTTWIRFLSEVETSIQCALEKETVSAIETFEGSWGSEFVSWSDRLSQAAVIALRVHLTRVCDGVIDGKATAFDEYKKKLATSLNLLTSHSFLELSASQRARTETLLNELAYQTQILENPLNKLGQSLLLKYCFTNSENKPKLEIRQAFATIEYGWEYLGIPDPLVVTPLIERLFLTMTNGLSQGFGISPFGPAGTGKTEGVKALGGYLGRLVIVFCCDETFNLRSMTRIINGISRIGAWGCFDEFNRLEVSTLSAVSTQIGLIESSLRSKCDSVDFFDMTIPLHPHTAVIITMNPLYSGRNILPRNVRQLFRPFAMTSPDMLKIAEVILLCRGFHDAKRLAQVLVELFGEFAKSFTTRKHYDWGLRALKGLLRVCGNLKRHLPSSGDELNLAVDALRQSVLPKLVAQDADKFYTLIHSHVGQVSISTDESLEFNDKLKDGIEKVGLVPTPKFLSKLWQLHRFISVNHGIMLAGHAGSGKTSTWKTLARVYGDVESYIIDAKSLSKQALYGSLEETTREWTDGVFTSILRRIIDKLKGEGEKQNWIIFDTDISSDWAENLNSVLDDNKTLTLPNGERLFLPNNVKIIFEVCDLDSATPATVTRCGMIWFDESFVDHTVLFDSGAKHFLESGTDEMVPKYKPLAQAALDIVEKLHLPALYSKAVTLDHVMDPSLCRCYDTFWNYYRSSLMSGLDSGDGFVERSCVLALLCAFVGDCCTQDQHVFLEFLAQSEDTAVLHPVLKEIRSVYNEVSSISGDWIPTQDYLIETEIEAESLLDADLIIPTVDTVRFEHVVQNLLLSNRSALLCGPPGAGKTMMLLDCLRKVDGVDVLSVNFNKTSSSKLVIKTLEEACRYSSTPCGTVLEPARMGRRLVLFCDEINLPACDQYGHQELISFLRGLISQGGFWKDQDWISVKHVQIIGACNPPTDPGRSPLPQRFLRLFTILHVDYPSRSSLHRIYSTINRAILKNNYELKAHIEPLTSFMLDVYQESRAELQNKRLHYTYTPRELTRWCRGLYEALLGYYRPGTDDFVRIVIHEGTRIFSDRLVSTEEKRWTWNLVRTRAAETFKEIDESKVFKEPLLYSYWLGKVYAPVSLDELRVFVDARLKIYSEEIIRTDIVLYDALLDHVLRLDRILRQPQGHMILMGPSSIGKTTLVKFVCWMNGISVHHLRTTRNYTSDNFVKDLRSVLKRAGCLDEQLCLILNESSLLESSFIERMNTLLANSEVPGLFEGDEYTLLISACKEGSKKEGKNITDEEDLLRWFRSRITKNLHVVFTVTGYDSASTSNAVASPALFSRCILDYFVDWDEASLQQIAEQVFRSIDTGAVSTDTISQACATTHNIVRSSIDELSSKRLAVTPGDYLAFLSKFSCLYVEYRTKLEEEQSHLNTGVDKLKGSMLEVKQLRSSLSSKEKELSIKESQCEATLRRMITDQSEAERKQEAALTIGQAVEQQRAEIRARTQQAQSDLERAQPMVVKAQEGVSSIKKQHLNELRSLLNPPNAIKLTLEGVCVLLSRKHSTWKEVLQSIRSDDFISSIIKFDVEQLPVGTLDKFQREYMSLSSFTFEAANRASKACGPLFQWIEAQVSYAAVLRRIAPLRLEIENLEAEAGEKEAQGIAITEMLKELETSIENYKSDYASLVAATQTIKAEIESVRTKVTRSVNLVESLSSEKTRWMASLSDFERKSCSLVGNCLLGAAYTTYTGFLDSVTRKKLMKRWRMALELLSLSSTDDLDVPQFLCSPEKRLSWSRAGLSTESLSLENASLLDQTNRPALVIDPSGKAEQFIETLAGKCITTSFLDNAFLKHVESALRFGTLLVVRNAECLDPVVMPLLNKEFQRKGGSDFVCLGSLEISASSKFRMILITRDSQMDLKPHITSRTTVVNFTLTQASLELLVLEKTLSSRRPEVDEKRVELKKLQGEYQLQLHQLELNLLQVLNEAGGQILEGDHVINSLEKVKSEASRVSKLSSDAQKALHDVNATLEEFQILASRAGRVFTIVGNLKGLDRSYDFSLELLLNIYQSVVADSSTPLDGILKEMCRAVYCKIAPGLALDDRRVLCACICRAFDSESQIELLLSDEPDDGSGCAVSEFTKLFGPVALEASDEEWIQVVQESKDNPVIFAMSNMDPTTRLQSVAQRLNKELVVCALGSSYSHTEAERALEYASRHGKWLLLQNVHMVPKWHRSLLNFTLRLSKHGWPSSFRLIITCELGAQGLPTSLLHVSRLVHVEDTYSLNASLLRGYDLVCSSAQGSPQERTRLVLASLWTHSLLKEMTLWTPLALSQRYDFEDVDLISSVSLVSELLEPFSQRSHVDPAKIDFGLFGYLLKQTIYGARVTEPADTDRVGEVVERALTPAIFEGSFELISGVEETRIPEDCSVEALQRFISGMPRLKAQWLGLSEGSLRERQKQVQGRLLERFELCGV